MTWHACTHDEGRPTSTGKGRGAIIEAYIDPAGSKLVLKYQVDTSGVRWASIDGARLDPPPQDLQKALAALPAPEVRFAGQPEKEHWEQLGKYKVHWENNHGPFGQWAIQWSTDQASSNAFWYRADAYYVAWCADRSEAEYSQAAPTWDLSGFQKIDNYYPTDCCVFKDGTALGLQFPKSRRGDPLGGVDESRVQWESWVCFYCVISVGADGNKAVAQISLPTKEYECRRSGRIVAFAIALPGTLVMDIITSPFQLLIRH